MCLIFLYNFLGKVEVMLDRKLTSDDDRGLGEVFYKVKIYCILVYIL